MMEEYQSIMKNDVWDVVPRPKGKLVVTSKWTFRIKHATNGSIEKYKARFVARGFSQKEVVFLKRKSSTMMKHLHLLQGTLPSGP